MTTRAEFITYSAIFEDEHEELTVPPSPSLPLPLKLWRTGRRDET